MGTVATMPQKKGRTTSASRLSPIKSSQKIFLSNAPPENIVRLRWETRDAEAVGPMT